MTIDTSPEFISPNIDIDVIDTTHLDALDVVNSVVDITDGFYFVYVCRWIRYFRFVGESVLSYIKEKEQADNPVELYLETKNNYMSNLLIM